MRNSPSIVPSADTRADTKFALPVVRGCFADFDEFTESAADWDIDFRQVGTGLLSADLLQLLDPQFTISKATFDRRCLQSGASPDGMRTFAILDNGAPETRFCGQVLDVNTIALFSKNGEFESSSPPGFDVFTLSIDETLLTELAGHSGGQSLHELLPDSTVVLPFRPGLLESLRTNLKQLFIPMQFQQFELAKQNIAAELLNLLGNRPSIDCTDHRLRRHELLRKAKEFIREHLADPVRVRDVAIAMGVTVRTVELVFKELLDVTPRTYIMTARLYAFRRSLKVAPPEKTIADIAGEWGYWHLGQLARDYRSRFGELPSHTLART